MKAKLMAVLLAVGLGVTGVAATAQAAEAGTQAANACEHSETIEFTSEEAINYDGNRHYVTYKTEYYCAECGVLVDETWRGAYEPHDYEQVYLGNGQVLSRCTVCGDSYVW